MEVTIAASMWLRSGVFISWGGGLHMAVLNSFRNDAPDKLSLPPASLLILFRSLTQLAACLSSLSSLESRSSSSGNSPYFESAF